MAGANFKEFHMKRFLVALVLVLGIVTVCGSSIGCGGGTTTGTKK